MKTFRYLALAGAMLAGTAAMAQERFITIGTGGQTGVYFVVGQSICRLVNRGTAEHNLDLSRRRAGSVESYLLSDSVAPQRLSSIGYGEDRPAMSNATEYGRTLNRRVEITIIPVVDEGTSAS